MYTGTGNVGLVVGLTVGLSFLFITCVGVSALVVCALCAENKRRRSTVRTHAVATTPSGGTTVVTANQASTTSAPIAQPPLQQQVYKDAQFSSQEAPPSYTTATAFSTYTGPYPQVECWLGLDALCFHFCLLLIMLASHAYYSFIANLLFSNNKKKILSTLQVYI